MNQLITRVFKIVILVLVLFGVSLILKNKYQNEKKIAVETHSKALTLKKYLLKFQKPQRIEIAGLSERYQKDILEIKKLKMPQDSNSDFYIHIELFSDESDVTAPLIAQIRFLDLKTDNTRKEESINLD